MDLLLPGMPPCLERWEKRGFSPGAEVGPGPTDRRADYVRVVGMEPPGGPQLDGPHARVARAILRYEVFPPRLVEPVIRRPVEAGDTVGARHLLSLGFSLFFASRVIETFDEPEERRWRTGFKYRTLVGHPTLGEETFCVEKDMASGEVRVALHTGLVPACGSRDGHRRWP